MRLLFFTAILSAALFEGCGGSEPGRNPAADANPAAGENPYPDVPEGGGIFDASRNLAYLQSRFSSAVTRPTPWAGYWWPYSTNGIASGAAKYDAAHPDNPSAASWERGRHGLGLGSVGDWWGHCNGWASAAILVPEPRQTKSVDGVDFSVGDQKALLTEVFMEVSGDFVGRRVNSAGDFGSAAFNDVTPSQFYLVLTNIMGNQERAVLIDRHTGYEVWNHPLTAFQTDDVKPEDYLGADPEFPSVHRVNMRTRVWWVDDNVSPDIVTPAFDLSTTNPVFGTRTLRYELWLDAPPVFDGEGRLVSSGNVLTAEDGDRYVGGVWKNSSLPSSNSHPDYMWMPTGSIPSSGYKNPRIDDEWVKDRF